MRIFIIRTMVKFIPRRFSLKQKKEATTNIATTTFDCIDSPPQPPASRSRGVAPYPPCDDAQQNDDEDESKKGIEFEVSLNLWMQPQEAGEINTHVSEIPDTSMSDVDIDSNMIIDNPIHMNAAAPADRKPWDEEGTDEPMDLEAHWRPEEFSPQPWDATNIN